MGAPHYLITCGRGGIGRRAALRSLWGNTRGSSSLLDRTNPAECQICTREPGSSSVGRNPASLAWTIP